MQNIPKIVRERLRSAKPAGNHPDADLLTAFAEYSLPQRERGVVIEHLSRCHDCRDVVAFAMPEAEAVQAIMRPSPRRWLTWPALRWGFVAAGIAVISFAALQLKKPSGNASIASQKSEAVKVAVNEPKNPALDRLENAAPGAQRDTPQAR